ncbi:MAG: hypothetical protein ACRD2Z_11960 [Thermoanaerobaculia bacterium]
MGFDETLLIAEGSPAEAEVERRAEVVLARELARQWPERQSAGAVRGERDDRPKLDNPGCRRCGPQG